LQGRCEGFRLRAVAQVVQQSAVQHSSTAAVHAGEVGGSVAYRGDVKVSGSGLLYKLYSNLRYSIAVQQQYTLVRWEVQLVAGEM
jgi:hypothetical protein